MPLGGHRFANRPYSSLLSCTHLFPGSVFQAKENCVLCVLEAIETGQMDRAKDIQSICVGEGLRSSTLHPQVVHMRSQSMVPV